MAEVIGPDLHLETVGRPPQRHRHDTGVVDQDVDTLVPGTRLVGERTDRREIRQVQTAHGRAVAEVGRDRLTLGDIAAGEHHLGTGPRQRPGGLRTESAVGPRHDHRASRQIRNIVRGPPHARHPTDARRVATPLFPASTGPMDRVLAVGRTCS